MVMAKPESYGTTVMRGDLVSRLLLLLLSVLLFTPGDGAGQSVHPITSPVTDTLLVRTQLE